MANIINGDSGSVSGTAGLKSSSDGTGILALQTNGTTAVTVDASQNVGIGTTTMNGRFNSTPKATYNASSTTWAESALSTAGNYGGGLSMIDGTAGYGLNVEDSGGSLVIRQGTVGSSPTERMRINSSGNLLVGTTTTAGKLTVNSGSLGVQAIGVGDGTIDTSAYGIVQITRPATNDTKFGLCFVRTGNQTAGIGFAATSNTFVVVNGANNSSNGMTLAVGGTSWGTQSDERKKNILGNIDNALEKISSLRTVFFEYKNDEYKTRKVGFIAQDVQTVLPEAVHVGDDQDNTLNLQYSDVIPLLTKAIQEQQALITTLTARITALEAK
jgi:hypothetical protein